MSLYRKASLFIAFLLTITSPLFAQMVQDNTKWTFEAKKKAGQGYEIIAHLKPEKGWHVYSMKPGGDGSLIPVKIEFSPNSKVKLTGAIAEKGKLISKTLEGIDGIVNMYADKVDYIQGAEINGATTIEGSYTYQICTETMCLPPNTKTFKISVK